MKRPRLKTLQSGDDFKLLLTFIDGSAYWVDFAPFFDQCPGLAPLRAPAAFAKAQIDAWGWTLEWPDLDIQIGADTLWLDAQAQNAPDEATRLFAGWRARHGLSLAQTAQALGLTTRTVSAYGSGARPIPKTVLLALKGWEVEQAGLDHNA